MSDLTTFDRLLAAGKLKEERHTLAGVPVIIRELSVDQLLEYQAAPKSGSEALALMISMAVHTEEGKPALTMDQARALMQGSQKLVGTAVEIAMRLSGLDDGGEEKKS